MTDIKFNFDEVEDNMIQKAKEIENSKGRGFYFFGIAVEDAIVLLNTGLYDLISYNDCHGGPSEYNSKCLELAESFASPNADIRLISAVHKLGSRSVSGRYSQAGFAVVRKEFSQFVYIGENDGLESPYYDDDKRFKADLDKLFAKQSVMSREEYQEIREEKNSGFLIICIDSREE